jgi:hypothetical protein
MSERVRARKEARQRERRLRGLPDPDTSDMSDEEENSRDGAELSPMAGNMPPPPASGPNNNNSNNNNNAASSTAGAIPLFSNPTDLPAPYSFNLPTPFQLPISPEPHFDYSAGNLDFKGPSPASFPIFNMFDPSASSTNDPQQQQQQQVGAQQPAALANNGESSKASPMSPATQAAAAAAQAAAGSPPTQPDLLTRLKACCHLSDSHVVNDPGLLIFATRLCQSFSCPFGGSHPDSAPSDDPEQMLLEDAWRALKATLDPGGDADGENRINTGRMAAELVVRAAASRGNGNWIVCRYKEGMTIRRALVLGLVQGFGGKLD